MIWNALAGWLLVTGPWQIVLLAICEVMLLAGCFFLLRRLPEGVVPQFLALFGFLNVVFYTFQGWGTYDSLRANAVSATSSAETSAAPSPGVSSRGNVYHIMLDAFSKYALAARSEEEIKTAFDGFTWYKNANSNYGRTNLSMRSVFAGDFHKEDILKWARAAFREGFTKDIHDAGIVQYYYPFYREYCFPGAKRCESTQDLYKRIRRDVSKALLLDALFINNLPPSLRGAAMGDATGDNFEFGFSITSWWATLIHGGGANQSRPIQSVTIDTFEDFLDAEPKMPGLGRYTYLHMMVPHGPTFADGACKIESQEAHEAKTREQRQDDAYSCALLVVSRTMNELRRLGRFENSLIIIHSDHGTAMAEICARHDPEFPFDPNVKRVNRDIDSDSNPSQQTACHSGALLMVKKPGQKGFTTSDERFELIDIAPTVLDHYGLNFSRFSGVSMLSDTVPPERVQTYFESTDGHLDKLNHLSRYELHDGVWRYIRRVPVVQAKEGS